ncbi:MAG: hypothetical protein SAJ12_06375 [Jaaginema sp. PMC 1079.18]|nr:hypothetical protein [Jaaginema sp. PMC 1080.18]MEC4850619.1 hypothetical protein [Jaaginema sp. PMC 1079.18]MEC4867820.1 hypothetical protein [Jaaginema sp. PMC 1078.18]
MGRWLEHCLKPKVTEVSGRAIASFQQHCNEQRNPIHSPKFLPRRSPLNFPIAERLIL